ncbi:hypothetical protein T265_07376 [Opisthorchis viverrini]|uniref:Uncharacterized protein n=1 Tax=Opisthorchis viverrini TaxID=6198 RepID=A0A075ABQ3_OPIVI|nr:hypothetical protein T265_07376 [Opisthorchis viverrini]KER25084.1 hypothetical protein T265_07376 [Opisthorchis viverrini]
MKGYKQNSHKKKPERFSSPFLNRFYLRRRVKALCTEEADRTVAQSDAKDKLRGSGYPASMIKPQLRMVLAQVAKLSREWFGTAVVPYKPGTSELTMVRKSRIISQLLEISEYIFTMEHTTQKAVETLPLPTPEKDKILLVSSGRRSAQVSVNLELLKTSRKRDLAGSRMIVDTSSAATGEARQKLHRPKVFEVVRYVGVIFWVPDYRNSGTVADCTPMKVQKNQATEHNFAPFSGFRSLSHEAPDTGDVKDPPCGLPRNQKLYPLTQTQLLFANGNGFSTLLNTSMLSQHRHDAYSQSNEKHRWAATYGCIGEYVWTSLSHTFNCPT